MRFLIDANLPRSTVVLLSTCGHAVEFARDIGLGAAADADIAAHAKSVGAALLTRDLDFADIRRYPPQDYMGIVVLRLADDATAPEIVAVLERFVKQSGLLAEVPGRLAIVERDRVRFRPALA
jgi:predicted nuclease of predicted toxin-antitoxin system